MKSLKIVVGLMLLMSSAANYSALADSSTPGDQGTSSVVPTLAYSSNVFTRSHTFSFDNGASVPADKTNSYCLPREEKLVRVTTVVPSVSNANSSLDVQGDLDSSCIKVVAKLPPRFENCFASPTPTIFQPHKTGRKCIPGAPTTLSFVVQYESRYQFAVILHFRFADYSIKFVGDATRELVKRGYLVAYATSEVGQRIADNALGEAGPHVSFNLDPDDPAFGQVALSAATDVATTLNQIKPDKIGSFSVTHVTGQIKKDVSLDVWF